MPASGGLAVYNARRFTCDSTAYPRIFVAFDGGLAMLRKPVHSRLPALFTPSRHKRDGFDFVTDKNKQVTHDP
ncbi:hypothetical protein GC387_12430 [Pseudomonas sp. MWU12-2323]|nr:hypothetical protein [Pseudomonas sp. MWU12-2323]RBH59558.1 hypothetical protein C3F00_000270 [Pseudomonas sp. MWU13-2860]